ncbi:MAG TPA: hypothetical protein VNK82_09480 [Terriglobales bacterium]|nr:hypothetical protein [Terriglobales bacterium]
MKLGLENRRMVALLALTVAAGLYTVPRMFRSLEPQPVASAGVAAVSAPSPRQRNAPRRARRMPPAASLDPTLRLDLLRASQETEYRGTGRNIFESQAEAPKPVVPVARPGGTPVAYSGRPPGPPPPPPINLKFFGFASQPGEPKRVFLSQGEDVFIGGEGDIINRRYKIVRIGASAVEVEDLQYNHRQTLPLTQS